MRTVVSHREKAKRGMPPLEVPICFRETNALQKYDRTILQRPRLGRKLRKGQRQCCCLAELMRWRRKFVIW